MAEGSMTPDELRSQLRQHRLLGIVRGPGPDRLLDCLRVLADNGLRLVEVSLTSTDALAVLRRAVEQLGDRLMLGAGTALTAVQVEAAQAAGASYIVTPADCPGAAAALERDIPVLLGALTPSEVWAAHERGAAAVKLFPASLGGPGYLRALRDPFPDVPLMPVGGVDAADGADYLAAGAVAVGVGSPLLGDAVHGGDLAALADRVRRWVEAVA
jgi:2-dehydro-3-deoxyphosphogluconate aldolase / (4S)-4-hydroxy-2-oxoglutarate aldolase